MKEKIMNINEFFDKTWYSNYEKKNVSFDGFEIVTDRQKIVLAICNEQQCCEDVGYFITNDNINDFVGSILYSIDYVDGELKVHTVTTHGYSEVFQKHYTNESYYVDNKREVQLSDKNNYALFVNLHTSKGKLQFVAYNAGNGYYGHTFELLSQQLTYSTNV